jgi:transcriptional regulator with XRE-family HTH domain
VERALRLQPGFLDGDNVEMLGQESLGKRLCRLRKVANLTQVELANKAGVAQSAIGNIEAGIRGYGASVVGIAKALGTTPEYLSLTTESSFAATTTPSSKMQLRPIQQAAIDTLTKAMLDGRLSDAECSKLIGQWVV